MTKFQEEFNSVCFLLAIVDIFLGTVNFMIHNNKWGCIFYGAALLLSFGVKAEPEKEDK